MDRREKELAQWAAKQPQLSQRLENPSPAKLHAVCADASARRYFRIQLAQASLIAVDAPPATEDSAAFVAIARAWSQAGIAVPDILAYDLEKGFLLLSDLGDEQVFKLLNAANAESIYRDALDLLNHIQSCDDPPGYPLPLYDEAFLRSEMLLCNQWFLTELLGMKLSASTESCLQRLYQELCDSAAEQPQGTVHRDFHSRNLMMKPDRTIAVIDFQGARRGPISYDVASLLRDCYLCMPDELEDSLLSYCYRLFAASGRIGDVEPERFRRWFDCIGLQRHIKCVGIFSRLYLRDHKINYLKDIPNTLNYILRVAGRYPEFAEFNRWLIGDLMPAVRSCEHLQAQVRLPKAIS